MPIKLVVAITDQDWFEHLRRRPELPEINFWAPSAGDFKALTAGELFLFKLHAPHNFIVGGGIFAYANALPCSLAWEAFGTANGALSLAEMRARILRYRRADPADRSDFPIGCRILTQPFFFHEAQFIPVPESWSQNIVRFKTYSVDDPEGRALWDAVQDRVSNFQPGLSESPRARYGEPVLIRPRLGQGAFRILVTDAYGRKCAVTGERTLPALDAAHIRPYAEGGEHSLSNGLLLRRDIHGLYDAGYVTVTPQLRFEVSNRIHEDFDNGKYYYSLRGQQIGVPVRSDYKPSPDELRWHNENCYRG